MKKNVLFVAVLLVFSMLICSCSKTKEYTGTVDSAAGEIVKTVTFSEELTEIEDETAKKIFGITDKVTDVCAYIGSGATAEEVSVWKLENAEDANAVIDTLSKRIESLAKDYADYDAEEVPKLEKAVVKSYGSFVVCCVCANGDAEKTIDDIMSK